MQHEIISDRRTMTITVGEQVFDKPELWRLPEKQLHFKALICGEAPWHLGAKAAYQYYGSLLGAKFNRRFHAANYWLWVGHCMTEKTANMLRKDGRHWHQYDDDLVFRAHKALPYVSEAERDGLYNLIPAIVLFGTSPQQLRRRIGQGPWRRYASNSLSRNLRIMHAASRTIKPRDGEPDPTLFVRLLDFPSGVLRAVFGANEDEVIASRITPRKRVAEFQQVVHLIRDTRRMTGHDFNPAWGYARLVEEHNAASRRSLLCRFSDKPFTSEWVWRHDGYTAALLTSQIDIAAEGSAQHHCVASYARLASSGKYAVFRIEGKERATAGFDVRNGRLFLDQLYGACNSAVSKECHLFAARVATEYAAQDRRAAA